MDNTGFTLHKTQPFPLGVRKETDGYRFSFVTDALEKGIALFSNRFKDSVLLKLDDAFACGQVYSVKVCGDFPKDTTYMLWQDGEFTVDPYATGFYPKRSYMEKCNQRCCLPETFQVQRQGSGPKIPYRDKIFYMLHPRGFSMKAAIKHSLKGTFAGIKEQLPYLKELGITSLILMPSYEFEERMEPQAIAKQRSVKTGMGADEYGVKTQEQKMQTVEQDMSFQVSTYHVDFERKDALPVKTNFWGYTDKNQYFSVKGSYAMGHTEKEFEELVEACHKGNLELFLQIYFPENTPVHLVLDVLLHWKCTYGVDGFHLMGATIPVQELLQAPVFSDTYLLFENIPEEMVANRANCGVLSNQFMFDMRNFLKGEPDVDFQVARHIRKQLPQGGLVHFMAKQDTMRLWDMVSYQEKHNQDNGEDNRDGTDYNCSWNCGAEGKTRKKNILALRKKQVKNAMCLLLLSQGTPLLYSGDEFCNSQQGNNNPYCQDNEISYIKWQELAKQKDFFDFTKKLLGLRKEYPVLKGGVSLQGTDYCSLGIPDISFHSKEAWRMDAGGCSHVFGVLYNNRYANKEDDSVLYIAYNMHWEPHELALPKLPGNKHWQCILSTEEPEDRKDNLLGTMLTEQETKVLIPERTILILKA